MRVVTANIPFTLKDPRKVKRQIDHVAFRSGASIVMLQEMRERNPQKLFDAVWRSRGSRPGENFRVLKGANDSNALAFRRKRFRFKGGAVTRAFPSGGGQPGRSFVWAKLLDTATGLVHTPVALHYPTNASNDASNRAQYIRMNENLRALIEELRSRGLHPITGGDYNHPLDVAQEPWSPVPFARSLNRTTNWLVGTPCASGTSARGGRIDGFTFDPGNNGIAKQGCLTRGYSDHRPVFADVTTLQAQIAP